MHSFWTFPTASEKCQQEVRNDDVEAKPSDDRRSNKIESTERKMILIQPWDERTNKTIVFLLFPGAFLWWCWWSKCVITSYNCFHTKSNEKKNMAIFAVVAVCPVHFVIHFYCCCLLVRRRSVYKLISFRSGTHRRRVLIKFVLFLDLIFSFATFFSSQFCIQSHSATANASVLRLFFVLFFHIQHRITFPSAFGCCQMLHTVNIAYFGFRWMFHIRWCLLHHHDRNFRIVSFLVFRWMRKSMVSGFKYTSVLVFSVH